MRGNEKRMSDDLISRGAAIDALGERPIVWTDDEAECVKTDRLILQPMDAELYCPIDGERWKNEA